jgi:predicted N-acyltransferase
MLLHNLTVKFIASIDDIDQSSWDKLCGSDYPFLRHSFFSAMEKSGSTTKKTGWEPHHLLIHQQQSLVAIVPLFIKTHSYGEYVFDWSWAEAYHRHGIEYYPKLVNAIPFTPATGQRWAIDYTMANDDILDFITATITHEAASINASSCHCLFPTLENSMRLANNSWQQRTGYQYHWFNKSYASFDDFLLSMSSRKRKNIIKERKKVQQQNISITIKEGRDISDADWKDFYFFYRATYIKRSGHIGYLSAEFFPLLAHGMIEHLVMIQAAVEREDGSHMVAAALCFKDSETLYGRYWGCKENFDSLHFEACYYQGIEYAIQQGLKRFDPGAQGEHKIQRGFTPIKTYSNHWLANAEFSDAIGNFLQVEAREVEDYIQDASQLLPFKAETQPGN